MGLSGKYDQLKEVLKERALPAMVVDMQAFAQNVDYYLDIVRSKNKKLRIATKSLRVPDLVRYIVEKGGTDISGLMCYSVREASFLAGLGFDNLMVTYPTINKEDLALFYDLTHRGINISLTVDSIDHVRLIEQLWRGLSSGSDHEKARLCIDVDVTWKPFGLHLGVYRSPVSTVAELEAVLDYVLQSDYAMVAGIMAYEAQVAGIGERNPYSSWLNPVRRLVKKYSVRDVEKKRGLIARVLEDKGVTPEFFNGGGTGSIFTTTLDASVTETAMGSGFLHSHLFDYYRELSSVPAFCFALEATRRPRPGMVTCQSGGFISSGELGYEKVPVPYLPVGLKMRKLEGFGEVQTPVFLPKGLSVALGDPLFFRPSKAGEIAEHFNEYLLWHGGGHITSAKTYRGFGKCFY